MLFRILKDEECFYQGEEGNWKRETGLSEQLTQNGDAYGLSPRELELEVRLEKWKAVKWATKSSDPTH